MRDTERAVEIGDDPALRALAEEVASTQEPRSLCRDGQEIARIVPVKARPRRRGRVPSEAKEQAFRAAAGSWKDIDGDALIGAIYASRDIPSRTPSELWDSWSTQIS